MPSLIILRLHPVKPVDAATFTSYLTGLSIEAFDLTLADSVSGVSIGTASGIANPHLGSPANNSVTIGSTSILQHYQNLVVGPSTKRFLQSAATAVIVANAPAGHPEYPSASSFDVRLRITRGGTTLVHDELEFNASVVNVAGPLSTDQRVYFAMPASAYVALPSAAVGLDPSLAHVDLPANGVAPPFADMVKAIDLVLAKDPGGTQLKSHPPLTAAESRQIAAEIVWNRALYPPPTPPRSLDEMYTTPASDADDVKRDRMQFEGELAGYQAVHTAEALRLAGFVYA
ncbi:MAG: hypothetical protein JO040_01400, partial [Gemmatimonadetes bacterium]|nr:hypothetical protein [Gemmatimonadota bacterium]